MNDSKKKPDGWSFIFLGVGLCVAGFIALHRLAWGDSSASRTVSMVVIGLPAGGIAIIIGLVKIIRGPGQ